MIHFSWKRINNKFEWNAQMVLQYFFLKRDIPFPPYLSKKIPSIVLREANLPYPKGPCFIIYPDKVLKEAKYPNDLYIYLELASMRNPFDHAIRGITYLPLIIVPEYLKEVIKVNPLLKIDDDKIYFKYEQEKQHGN